MSSLLPSPHLQRQPLSRSSDFPGVLAMPKREQVPEGPLYRFRFDNGYGALVLQHARPQSEAVYEVCLLDCTRDPARPTFEHLICPEVMFGLSQSGVSDILIKAERLPRHPRLTHVDDALLGEDF